MGSLAEYFYSLFLFWRARKAHIKLCPNYFFFSKKWLLRENWFGIQKKKCIIFKRIDTCKQSLLLESWKDHSSPFVIFTLCCTFQAIFEYQNLFYWVWIDFKNSEFILPRSIRQEVKTLLTITLWLNLTMKSRTTLPHLDKGGGGERHCLIELLGLWENSVLSVGKTIP